MNELIAIWTAQHGVARRSREALPDAPRVPGPGPRDIEAPPRFASARRRAGEVLRGLAERVEPAPRVTAGRPPEPGCAV